MGSISKKQQQKVSKGKSYTYHSLCIKAAGLGTNGVCNVGIGKGRTSDLNAWVNKFERLLRVYEGEHKLNDKYYKELIKELEVKHPRKYKSCVSAGLIAPVDILTFRDAVSKWTKTGKVKLGSTLNKNDDAFERFALFLGDGNSQKGFNYPCHHVTSDMAHKFCERVVDATDVLAQSNREKGAAIKPVTRQTTIKMIKKVFNKIQRELEFNPFQYIDAAEYIFVSKAERIREKTYITLALLWQCYNAIYHRNDDPENSKLWARVALVQLYVWGQRLNAIKFDTWEDILWDDKDEFPIKINFHYNKTGSRRAEDSRVGQIGWMPCPELLAVELAKLRQFNLEHGLPVKGKLYPVLGSAREDYDLGQAIKYDLEKAGIEMWKAFGNSLRATASTNIYDFGDMAMENRILKHSDKQCREHYIGSLMDDYERFARMPQRTTNALSSFYDYYNEFLNSGDQFKKRLEAGVGRNTEDNAVVVTRTSVEAM